MKSIQWTVTRARATRQVQADLAAVWVWSYRSLAAWDAALADLGLKVGAVGTALVAWRVAAQALDGTVGRIEVIARDVLRMGKVRFRAEAEQRALFDGVRVVLEGRTKIQQAGRAVQEAWAQADAGWEPLPGVTLAGLASLLATAEAQEAAWSQRRTAWRVAGIAVQVAARALDRDNTGWYSDATTRFRAESVEGRLIRAQVPTLNAPRPAAGRAVIANVQVAGRRVQFEVKATYARKFTCWHQAPGSPGFVVVAALTKERSFALGNLGPGVHRFKASGRNAGGAGPESAVLEVTIAQEQAA